MSIKVIAQNRKAFHNFELGQKFEAGLALKGTEVKSLRLGKCNLSDGWVDIDNQGNAILMEVNISQYSHGNILNHPEKRPRQLLLHKNELNKIAQAIQEKGMTIVPTKIYFKDHYIKIEIALAKGKKLHDKRASEKKKQAQKDIERAMKR